jgi:predicted nucleotidyltransferase
MQAAYEMKIKQFLIKELDPFLIYLFGSAVKGRMRKDSDIDIAYLSDKSIDQYQQFMLAQDLAAILDKDVDLVDLNKVSTVFQAQIIYTGQIIYCCDQERRMKFEMKTFKMYAKLNEERKIIIDGIKESGSIYGK